MRNYAAEPRSARVAPSHAPPDPPFERNVDPLELADWLEQKGGRLVERWNQGLQAREGAPRGDMADILREFLDVLVAFLPAVVGPQRESVEHLWVRGSELFGAIAARRGLAAGEVVEEFQLLREAVIRLLYQDPPLAGRARLSLREVLRLNRALDRGVTHASVGYTDALFFTLFEGSGVPDTPDTSELVNEVRSQVGQIVKEFREGWSRDGLGS